MGKWIIIRKQIYEPVCHIPLIQPFIHASYLFEFNYLTQDEKANIMQYENFSNEQIGNHKDSLELQLSKDKLEEFATINKDIKNYRLVLQGKFLKLKILEAFLEGGPQFILQMTIMMQNGPSSYSQYVTIATSLLSFSLAATKILLNFPTEVS